MNRFAILAGLSLAALPACTSTPLDAAASAGESALATAPAPIALAGEYRFAGDVKPLGRLTVDVIDERMTGAAERLETVRAGGGNCSRVLSTTWRCTTMRTNGVPSSSLVAMAEAAGDLVVSFDAPTAPPALVSEAESLVEWTIFQTGESSTGGAFGAYRYLDLQGDLVKIVLPTAGGSLELTVRDESHLGKWTSKRVSEGQWRWHEDMAVLVLER
jgi:hypothetical protein